MQKWKKIMLWGGFALLLIAAGVKQYYNTHPDIEKIQQREKEEVLADFHVMEPEELLDPNRPVTGIVYIDDFSTEGHRMFARVMQKFVHDYDIVISFLDASSVQDHPRYQEVMTRYAVRRLPDVFFLDKNGSLSRHSAASLEAGETFDQWVKAHGVKRKSE